MYIEITEAVSNYICNHADIGYESRYKQERMGFLFGTESNGKIKITKAVSYKGGLRSRSSTLFDGNKFTQRANQLMSMFRKAWIGTYHTHVEEDGELFIGLSEEDKESFMDDPIRVGLIVAIWATDDPRIPRQGQKRFLAVKQMGNTNYRYSISGYLITKHGPRLAKLKVI